MQNKHWIVEGWSNMWMKNGGPIIGLSILSLLILVLIKPIWVMWWFLTFVGFCFIGGIYVLFIDPFVEAYKDRKKE